MELLQLRYFYESAKNESFAKTAEKYMVPASSVSASIRRLEEELGKKLFDRQSNRCRLNEAGRELQRSCMLIFEELDGVVERITSVPPETVTIKMLLLCLREQTVEQMIQFRKTHPDVHFNAVLGSIDADINQFDLIVDIENDEKYSDYNKVELASYQLCFCATADSPLVGKELSLTDLRHEHFITMEVGNGQDAYLFERCSAAGFYPDIVVQTNEPHCYQYCTQAGLGISLWRKGWSPHPEGLVELSVSDFHARRTMCLYYRSTYTNTVLIEFVEFLRQMEI